MQGLKILLLKCIGFCSCRTEAFLYTSEHAFLLELTWSCSTIKSSEWNRRIFAEVNQTLQDWDFSFLPGPVLLYPSWAVVFWWLISLHCTVLCSFLMNEVKCVSIIHADSLQKKEGNKTQALQINVQLYLNNTEKVTLRLWKNKYIWD